MRSAAVPAGGRDLEAAARFSNGNAVRYRDGGHPRQRFLTPAYVLEPVRQALGGVIGLDPCTEPDNPAGAELFYTIADDGLMQPWDTETIFVNPPYNRAPEPWADRCIEAAAAGSSVVLLMPAATDTRIWQRAASTGSAVCFIRGRVKFGVPRSNGRQYAASHPSALIGWNTGLAPCGHLGLLVGLAGRAGGA
jgi:hypothetical protein